MKFKYLIILIIFTNCQSNMNHKIIAPVCEVENKLLTAHNHDRIDKYYWLKDKENPKVINYLKVLLVIILLDLMKHHTIHF